jgi:hypothetical protein
VSSHRVGPSYDTLKVVIQPYPGHTRYSVTRLHFEGHQQVVTRVGSGNLALSPGELAVITPAGLLERLLDQLRTPAQRPASPSGDHRGQATLDLDFTE